MDTQKLLSLFLSLLLTSSALAEVKVSSLFADHMVLQRNAPVAIWGTAAAGEGVRVDFADQTQSVTAGQDGKWMVKLNPLVASDQGRELKVQGTNIIAIKDVLVGDVWLASGQSNMAYQLNPSLNGNKAVAESADAGLRFFTVSSSIAAEPQSDIIGKWEVADPKTSGHFSAVAYYFARELRRTQKCPIAILHASWGGTQIEVWTGIDALRRDPALTKPIAAYEKALAIHRKLDETPQTMIDFRAAYEKWKAEYGAAHAAAMNKYYAEKDAGKDVSVPQPEVPEPVNPDPTSLPSPRPPRTPSVAFNAMIYPLAPYSIKGSLWYQGEGNGGAGIEYRALLPRLIECWRTTFNQGNFPFLIVQLPGFGKDTNPVANNGWPYLREAQLMTLSQPNTAMAVAIDVGDPGNVHPKDKVNVGVRLALAARKLAYNESIVSSGPMYKSAKVEGSSMRITFTDIGTGLTIGQSPWLAPGRSPVATDKLAGFYIAGEDKKWFEAQAAIDGDTVIVTSPQVAHPVAVRYAWANSPACNLYNKEALPASPFRTDGW